MKPMLKAPGSMLLKLRSDGLPSKSAFNFNLRRYNEARKKAAEEYIYKKATEAADKLIIK
jgi:hypothetical protein